MNVPGDLPSLARRAAQASVTAAAARRGTLHDWDFADSGRLTGDTAVLVLFHLTVPFAAIVAWFFAVNTQKWRERSVAWKRTRVLSKPLVMLTAYAVFFAQMMARVVQLLHLASPDALLRNAAATAAAGADDDGALDGPDLGTTVIGIAATTCMALVVPSLIAHNEVSLALITLIFAMVLGATELFCAQHAVTAVLLVFALASLAPLAAALGRRWIATELPRALEEMNLKGTAIDEFLKQRQATRASTQRQQQQQQPRGGGRGFRLGK